MTKEADILQGVAKTAPQDAPAAKEPPPTSEVGKVGATAYEIAKDLCVTADTLLTLEDGRNIPIVKIKPGDHVLSLNEATQTIEPHRINGLLDMGVKPVYKLTTASGRSIKTTANHPYLTQKGWVKVEQLGVGEEIGVPRQEVLASIGLVSDFNTLNENNVAFDVKRHAVTSDTETMGAWRKIYQRFSADRGI